jgi:hypothetical protein
VFCALAPKLRQITWPDEFKPGPIDKYDGSNNPEESIQVYHMIIDVAGGDDWVEANCLATTLTGAAKSWLISLPESTIYNWDQSCAMFIGNFQDTYECPSTVDTLKTIKQKPDESLREYVKYLYNARNAILYIQDIEIINTFHYGVSDIKTVEEIAMMKPKIVIDLLAVADVCIEASKARAQLLESCNKGPSKNKKQEDWEVNTADHGDRGNHGNRQQQPTDQKEKRSFRQPANVEKWCQIHRTVGHDLEECKMFLDLKKMQKKLAAQEPRRGEHCRTNSNNEDQMNKINVIFRGNLSITSKTQGKKVKREISLAQRIEPERRIKLSRTDIMFGSVDHPEIEPSNRNLPFVVKLPTEWHKVAKTLVDNRASLNLIMRKTFIEMGLNLADLTPVHDTFHGVILGQSSTPIRRIDLEVSSRSRDNKRREMLMFEVASFDIGYNCIIGRHFLLKFMIVIYTAYATIKTHGPKGIITIKVDQ